MKPDGSTGVNIKAPAGAKRNMRRGTGIRCAIMVLIIVVSAFNGMARESMGFEGEAMRSE